MKNIIKKQDDYGYPIKLTIDDDMKSSHRTIIGGILTILSKIFVILFFCLNFKKMLNFEDNKLSQTSTFQNRTETGTLNYTDAGFNLNMAIFNISTLPIKPVDIINDGVFQ